MKKSLDLLVLEHDKLVRKNIAKIVVNPTAPLNFRSYLADEWDEEKMGIRGYSLHLLADNYFDTISEVHRLFAGTVNVDLENHLYFVLLGTRFRYARADAYEKIKPIFPKEREQDEEIIAAAHYQDNEIIVSLPKKISLKTVHRLSAHEFGHRMHQELEPINYQYADSTIKELAAFLVEDALAVRILDENGQNTYNQNTTHYRAEELLRKAERTKFKELAFADRWNILKLFRKQDDLNDYLDGKLHLFKSKL